MVTVHTTVCAVVHEPFVAVALWTEKLPSIGSVISTSIGLVLEVSSSTL
jgi:hypothetical protein